VKTKLEMRLKIVMMKRTLLISLDQKGNARIGTSG
jgi:hypothetical protein